MLKNRYVIFSSIVLLCGLLCCSSPTKEENKKQRVRLLVDDVFEETGRYVFYWDGKDDNKKYVKPGRYIYAMQTKEYDSWEYVTVNTGGKTGANNEEHFEPGFWHSFELEEAFPNPFELEAGTNIPFLVSEKARVKILIYKE